jgi:DNA-binding transcriptional LysR family regulator
MVAFLPRYVMEEELERGELRAVTVGGVGLQENLWLFRRRGKRHSPLHEAAVTALRTHLTAATAARMPA